MTCHQSKDPVETRQKQLRAAKRRQRLKDKEAGQALYQLKLPVAHCDRFKTAMQSAGFVSRFFAFLQHEVIRVDDCPNLAMLCWNRDLQYMTREDAFKLYERNWRLLDSNNLDERERSLIQELKDEFGQGLINA